MVVTRGAEKRGTGVGLREKGERGSGNGCVHIIPSVLLISSKSSSSRATPSSLRSSLGFRINKASTISRLFSLHPWTARRQLPKWTRTLAERIKEKERENTLLPVLNNGMRWAAVNKCVSTNCKRMRVDARTHTHTFPLSFSFLFVHIAYHRGLQRTSLNEKKTFKRTLSLSLSLFPWRYAALSIAFLFPRKWNAIEGKLIWSKNDFITRDILWTGNSISRCRDSLSGARNWYF